MLSGIYIRKSKMIEVICRWCGKIFEVVPSIAKIGKGKYCNKKCYNNFIRKYPNKGAYKKEHIVTIETRNKISNSKKGHIGYWKGKVRSEETKLNISKKHWQGGAKESNKRNYIKNRKYDLKYILNSRMREGFHRTLKKGIKNGRHWESLINYTYKQLKKHLQKTIPSGYSWADFINGKLHIDHIIPISEFEFDKPEDLQFKKCWALRNLRLLPKIENMKKHNKLIKSFQLILQI